MNYHNKKLLISILIYFTLYSNTSFSSPIFIAAGFAATRNQYRYNNHIRQYNYWEEYKKTLVKSAQKKIYEKTKENIEDLKDFDPKQLYKDLSWNKNFIDKELKKNLKKDKNNYENKKKHIEHYYQSLDRLIHLDVIDYEIKILNIFMDNKHKIESEYKNYISEKFYDFDDLSIYYMHREVFLMLEKVKKSQKDFEMDQSLLNPQLLL